MGPFCDLGEAVVGKDLEQPASYGLEGGTKEFARLGVGEEHGHLMIHDQAGVAQPLQKRMQNILTP